MSAEDFDITQYFEDQQVDYHKAGEKNVTRGWININCPYEDCDDPSWHCGINLKTMLFSCYHCHRKGHISQLIARIEKCSFQKAEKIIESYYNPLISLSNQELTRTSSNFNTSSKVFKKNPVGSILPEKELCKDFPNIHIKYLLSRGFDPEYLIEKYKLRAIYNLSKKYKYRIIIPIIVKNKIVSFTAMDITKKSQIPYRHYPDEKSIIPINHIVYNIDNIKNKIIIVEGITDVWTLGDGAVATFGTNFTSEQISFLRNRGIKETYILFDAETHANEQSMKLANTLSTFIPYVEQLKLDTGDPAEMSRSEVIELRKELKMESK